MLAPERRAGDGLRPRCYRGLESPELASCHTPARWHALSSVGQATAFYCDAHRPAHALPMGAGTTIRAVRLTLDVELAGVSLAPAVAHSEALLVVERALEAIGARLSVHQVTSEAARAGLPPPRGTGESGEGRP